MSFWDFFKEDNSIKTTQEHFEYFENVRKKNIEDISNHRINFLLGAKVPDEFNRYVRWVSEDIFCLDIPYLEYPIVVEHTSTTFSSKSSFRYGSYGWMFDTFEEAMGRAIGTNKVKVK
jgi:hypothetical protein